MFTMDQIIKMNEDGAEYYAIGDNGKKYEAIYSSDFQMMFFVIPSNVNILGYVRA